MPFVSLNPATNQLIHTHTSWDSRYLESMLEKSGRAQQLWGQTSFSARAGVLRKVAAQLLAQRDRFATLITLEMGKPTSEARAEVEKCAGTCEYYARNGEEFLRTDTIESDAGKSYVAYYPLGVVLAVMPWNFPFWQVFRAAAPALMAGNAVVLKHAPNVPKCALAMEAVFRDSGLPEGVFANLMIEVEQVAGVIANPYIRAVTLTGSEAAGRKVAASAGQCLKKCVLELGGSDPFIVLHDADMDLAVSTGSEFAFSELRAILHRRETFHPGAANRRRFYAPVQSRSRSAQTGRPDARRHANRSHGAPRSARNAA